MRRMSFHLHTAAEMTISGPDVFAVLVPVTDSDDQDIALAASRAVALAKFNPDQFADLVLKKRVQDLKAAVKK